MFAVSMDINPIVSVITPNFNGEHFIRRVVESTQQQNYSLEHIIIDDCSTDGSWALLQRLGEKYPWLKPIRLAQKSGPIIARNEAIRLAQGRFLAFLDVDDLWTPQKLTIQIDFMLAKGCGLSFTDYRQTSEDGQKIGRCIKGFNQVGFHVHHMTRYIGCLTVVIDRRKIPNFYFESMSTTNAEDFLAWSRCINLHGPALRCPYDLARYTVMKNSRSSNKLRQPITVWKIYRNNETISYMTSMFYILIYLLSSLWKRFWYRPTFHRALIDCSYKAKSHTIQD